MPLRQATLTENGENENPSSYDRSADTADHNNPTRRKKSQNAPARRIATTSAWLFGRKLRPHPGHICKPYDAVFGESTIRKRFRNNELPVSAGEVKCYFPNSHRRKCRFSTEVPS